MLGRQPGDALCCLNAVMSPGGCGTGDACFACSVRAGITRALQSGQATRGMEVCYTLQVNGEARSFWFLNRSRACNFERRDSRTAGDYRHQRP